jgi:ribose/xylose/arabinose/galactoside ABC-type transport system permease subunit
MSCDARRIVPKPRVLIVDEPTRGVSTCAGAVIGALLIGVSINGLVTVNLPVCCQRMLIGLLILAAGFDTHARPRRGGKR